MKLDLYRLLSEVGGSIKNLRLRGHFWCLSKWNISGTRVVPGSSQKSTRVRVPEYSFQPYQTP